MDALQIVVERVPPQQLHHHIQAPVLLTHVVDGDQVAMLQAAGDFCLPVEALARLRIAFEVGHHDLDGNTPCMLLVEGAVDDAHGALADPIDDAIAADRFRQLPPGPGGDAPADACVAHPSASYRTTSAVMLSRVPLSIAVFTSRAAIASSSLFPCITASSVGSSTTP